MTDEQLQKLIEHKVEEATAPLERRWESLRRIAEGWESSAGNWSDRVAYASVLATMAVLEKHYEPRRKLPTDPRRVKK
jgi:hypothetical protein